MDFVENLLILKTQTFSMSAVEIRMAIDQHLRKVKDEGFLKVVYSMLDTYLKEQEDPVIGYEIDGKEVRASVARKQFEADIEAAKRGDFISLDDLERESETW